MKTHLTIAAIIPTFRRPDYLLSTIQQLLVQTRVPDEIIVVDQTPPEEIDASVHQRLVELQQNHRHFVYDRQAAPHVYRARNAAARLAKSDVLLYLDDDVRLDRRVVEHHISILQNDDVDAAVGRITTRGIDRSHFPSPPSGISPIQHAFSFGDYRDDVRLERIAYCAAGHFSIRRAVLEAIGGWDEHILTYGDKDMGLRLYAARKNVVYDPRPSLVHLVAPAGGARLADPQAPWPAWQRAASIHYLALRHLGGSDFCRYGLARAARHTFLLRANALRPWRWPAEIWGYLTGLAIARRWAHQGLLSSLPAVPEGTRCRQTGHDRRGRRPIAGRAVDAGRAAPVPRGTSCPPRLLVAQLGARMHYAVPRMLEEAGLLERFYCDICAVKGWPHLLGLIPAALRPKALRRLAGRVPHGVPTSKMTAFTQFGTRYAWRLAAARSSAEVRRVHLWAGKEFSQRVALRSWGQATGVYTFNGAGLEILEAAERRGLLGVLEQTIAPRETQIRLLCSEQQAYPAWVRHRWEDPHEHEFIDRQHAEWSKADLIICGSEFVRQEIARCQGPSDRCRVVPYGYSGPPVEPRATRDPKRTLRVLTIGEVGLRKGSVYVLAAAKALGRRADFRMVGPIGVSAQAEAELRRYVELVGPIPRAEIGAHYRWADVFLLPSLCEGSATVVYEALWAGLPVIATPNTGSVVRHGRDGFLVPIRDPGAIIEHLEQLATTPELLNRMSDRARRRAEQFTLQHYARRLIRVITGAVMPAPQTELALTGPDIVTSKS